MLSIRLRTWLLIFAVATTAAGLLGKEIWDAFHPTATDRLRAIRSRWDLPLPRPVDRISMSSGGERWPLSSGWDRLSLRVSPIDAAAWMEATRVDFGEWSALDSRTRKWMAPFGCELVDEESAMQLPTRRTRDSSMDLSIVFADPEQGIIEIIYMW